MATPSQEKSFILVRRQTDGMIDWLPLEGRGRLPVENGESYTLIDRADYEAPDALVVERRGPDLVLSTGGTQVFVLAGFFAAEAVVFHPTTDIASGAGPFAGEALTAMSPVGADGVLFSAEITSTEAAEAAAVASASSGGGGGISPMVWGGLAAGLGLAAVAAGGGGGGGGGDGTGITSDAPPDDSGPEITSSDTASIDENVASGTTVYAAQAESDDAVTWSLADSGDGAAFTIDPDSGRITINDSPDFETQRSYSLTLVATDTAGNRSEQIVTLTVNDLDETTPMISAVMLADASGIQNGLLGVGDTVTVSVTWSETVTVETSAGTPRVILNIGGENAVADYLSGSGTDTLLFQYTITAGDRDDNGISIRSNSLETNGGSITDAAGNPANTVHGSVPGNGDFRVDAIAPVITGSDPADDETDFDPDDDIEITFSENIQAGSGNVTLTNGTDSRIIDIRDSEQISISGSELTIDPDDDLVPGTTYRIGIDSGAVTDAAGNPYPGIGVDDDGAITFSTEGGTDSSIVIFDLVSGNSSDHSGRTFRSDESYDIYIIVPSDDSEVRLSGRDRWDGAENLGSDDRVILVGDDGAVRGAFFAVNRVVIDSSAIAWRTGFGLDAAILEGRSLTRATEFGDDGSDDVRLFDSEPPDSFFQGQNGQLSTMYLTTLPPGILTSQGLV